MEILTLIGTIISGITVKVVQPRLWYTCLTYMYAALLYSWYPAVVKQSVSAIKATTSFLDEGICTGIWGYFTRREYLIFFRLILDYMLVWRLWLTNGETIAFLLELWCLLSLEWQWDLFRLLVFLLFLQICGHQMLNLMAAYAVWVWHLVSCAQLMVLLCCCEFIAWDFWPKYGMLARPSWD